MFVYICSLMRWGERLGDARPGQQVALALVAGPRAAGRLDIIIYVFTYSLYIYIYIYTYVYIHIHI